MWGRGEPVFGKLLISLCEDRRLKDAQNLKFEHKRLQNRLALKTLNVAAKQLD